MRRKAGTPFPKTALAGLAGTVLLLTVQAPFLVIVDELTEHRLIYVRWSFLRRIQLQNLTLSSRPAFQAFLIQRLDGLHLVAQLLPPLFGHRTAPPAGVDKEA